MTREEAIEKIALNQYQWGQQRDMFLHDDQGREMDRTSALDVLRGWASRLPEATFRWYTTLASVEVTEAPDQE